MAFCVKWLMNSEIRPFQSTLVETYAEGMKEMLSSTFGHEFPMYGKFKLLEYSK